MQKGTILLLTLLLFAVPAVQGATVAGAIYDLSLNPLEDVVVRINTTPVQTYVAKENIYAFEVSEGSYVMHAVHEGRALRLSAEEEIIVTDDNRFIIDLILFPEVEDEQDFEYLSVDPINFGKPLPYFQWFLIGFAVLIITLLMVFYFSKRDDPIPHLDDEDLGKMLQFIKDQGGRVSQKDLRKEFPLSEAKISLMVTELEFKGHLEKIKKGKGNILILKR